MNRRRTATARTLVAHAVGALGCFLFGVALGVAIIAAILEHMAP